MKSKCKKIKDVAILLLSICLFFSLIGESKVTKIRSRSPSRYIWIPKSRIKSIEQRKLIQRQLGGKGFGDQLFAGKRDKAKIFINRMKSLKSSSDKKIILLDLNTSSGISVISKYPSSLRLRKKRIVIVKPGESLSEISKKRYGSASPDLLEKIAKLNSIENINRIDAGKALYLPRRLFLEEYIPIPLEEVLPSAYQARFLSSTHKKSTWLRDRLMKRSTGYSSRKRADEFAIKYFSDLQAREFGPFIYFKKAGTFANNMVIDLYTKDGEKLTIDKYNMGGKDFPLFLNSHEYWIPKVLEELKGKIKSENFNKVVVGGDNIPGRSFANIFSELRLDVIRVSTIDPSKASKLVHKEEILQKRLSEARASNTTVLYAMPSSESEMLKLGKNVKNKEKWLEVSKNLTDTLNNYGVNFVKSATNFKDILLSSSDKIIVTGDAKDGKIYFPKDNSFISLEEIKRWEPQKKEGWEPPLLIIYSCETGYIKKGAVGEISKVLIKKGYVSVVMAPVGLIKPDLPETHIKRFLEGKMDQETLEKNNFDKIYFP